MIEYFSLPVMQGYRFSDESSLYYSADDAVFYDLAGYGKTNNLTITAGTPAFVTDSGSGRRGLTLDNTVQGSFFPACPWMASYIAVMKPDMSVNGTVYPAIWGGAATTTSNGTLRLIRGGASSFIHRMATPSGVKTASITKTTQALIVSGYAFDQSDRKAYVTEDGVTVTSDSALADNNQGLGLSMGSSNTANEGAKVRFGNLSGTAGDTSATTNTMTIFEFWTFAGNIWNDYPDEAEALMTKLNTYYGI